MSSVPALEDEIAGLDVAARAPHVLAELGRLDLDPITVGARALDHHDRVGAVGHRRAGHDADRLARTDRDRRRAARGELADDAAAFPGVSAARTA